MTLVPFSGNSSGRKFDHWLTKETINSRSIVQSHGYSTGRRSQDSMLRKREFEEPEISHFGNFWILGKGKNQNKSDKHPAQFFADVSDSEMHRAKIDREMLDYRRF